MFYLVTGTGGLMLDYYRFPPGSDVSVKSLQAKITIERQLVSKIWRREGSLFSGGQRSKNAGPPST